MSRRRLLQMLAICIVFVVVGIWLVLGHISGRTAAVAPIAGWFAIAFFGVLGIPSLTVQLLARYSLTLGPDSFTLTGWRPRRVTRSWLDCTAFTVGRGAVNYRLEGAAVRNEAIPAGYGGLSAAELTALLNRYRDIAAR